MGDAQPEEQQPVADDPTTTGADAPQTPQQPGVPGDDDDGGAKPDTVFHG